MKKYLFILIAIILIIPVISFATEGTCSWHGGVDCEKGPDIDDSAICNDGWRDSSEDYYDTKECMQNKHSCYGNVADSLLKKYPIKEQQLKINKLSDKLKKTFDKKYQEGISSEERSAYTEEFNSISLELIELRGKLETDMSLFKRECYSKGEQQYWEGLAESFKKTNLNTNVKDLCISGGVLNSHQEGEYCICNSGFYQSAKSKICINLSQFCKENLGIGGIQIGENCGCTEGYTLNIEAKKCIENKEKTGSKINKETIEIKKVITIEDKKEGNIENTDSADKLENKPIKNEVSEKEINSNTNKKTLTDQIKKVWQWFVNIF